MRLPDQDSSTGRGIKTAVQAILGFFVGLIVVIWNVPGVPEAVVDYTKGHLVELLGIVGLSSGVASFIWNLLRRDVENY